MTSALRAVRSSRRGRPDRSARPFGPPPRDELAAWSTVTLEPMALDPVPAFTDPVPGGSTLMLDGQGVFLRRVARTGGSAADGAAARPDRLEADTTRPDAWYVHGLGGNSTDFAPLALTLANRAAGYLPDLPGAGRSDPPPAGRYRIVAEADLLARLIRRHSSDPVHVVGNSRGGVVATVLAARHPDLVRTLTVISPAVPDLRLGHDRGADPALALVLIPGVPAWAERRLATVTPVDRVRSMAAVCFAHPERLSDDDLAVAIAENVRRADLPWAQRSVVDGLRSLVRFQFRPAPWSFWSQARRVRAPVLVVWGTRDRLVDARLARRTCAAFREARLLMLPECGHVAQMERPLPTAQAIAALWSAAGPDAGEPRSSGHATVAAWHA